MPTTLQVPGNNPLGSAGAPTLASPRTAPRERSDAFDRTLADVADSAPRRTETRSTDAQGSAERLSESESTPPPPAPTPENDTTIATETVVVEEGGDRSPASDTAASDTAASDSAAPVTPDSARPVAQPTVQSAQSLQVTAAEGVSATEPIATNQETSSGAPSSTTAASSVTAANDANFAPASSEPTTTGALVPVETSGPHVSGETHSSGTAAPSIAAADPIDVPIARPPDTDARGQHEQSGEARTSGDTPAPDRVDSNPAPRTDSIPDAGRVADPVSSSTERQDRAVVSERRSGATTAAAPAASAATPAAASTRGSTAAPTGPTNASVSSGELVAVEATAARNGAEAETNAGRGDSRGASFDFGEGGRNGLSPASARAVQVEAAVQLANLAGPAASGDALAPPLTPTTNGLAALTGGLRADAVEQLVSTTHGADSAQPLTNRVVRGLATMINQHGGVMNMRLTPPELGDLRVQMSIVQGTVTADFTASTEQAQAALNRSLGVLRGALESHGLNVERLAVHVSSAENGQSTRHETGDQTNQQNQRESHDAAREESRGRRDDTRRDSRWQREAPADFTADLAALTAESREHELAGALAR